MAIDPALRQQLIDRGMYDKVVELEAGDKNASVFKQIPKSLDVPAKVAKVVAPLGGSVGAALATPTAKKLQAESTKSYSALADTVMTTLKNPNVSREQKQKVYNIFSQANPDIISKVPELQETAAQTFGKAAITGLTALSGGSLSAGGALGGTAAKIISAGNVVSKLGKSTEIGKTGVMMEQSLFPSLAGSILRTAQNFGSGAAWGVAMALESGKTKISEIGKEAGILGAVSVLLPPILGRTFKFAAGEIGNIAKVSNARIEQMIPYLKNLAGKTGKNTGNWLVDSASPKTATFIQTAAEAGARVASAITKPLDVKLTDRLKPIETFEDWLGGQTNQQISMTPSSAYIKARNYAGIPEGKYTVAATDFDNLFEKGEFKDIKDDVYGYIKGLDLMDRAGKGQVLEAGQTSSEVSAMLREIEGRVPRERLQAAITAYNDFTKKNILAEYVNSGVNGTEGMLTKAQANKIIEDNPNWTPHVVLDFQENLGNTTFKGGGGSFNVHDTAIKAAKGSERDLAPTRVATLNRLHQAQTITEKNRVVSTLIDNVEKSGLDPEVLGFTPLRTAEKVETRQALFDLIGDTVSENKKLLEDRAGLKDLQDKAVGKIKRVINAGDKQSIKDLRRSISQTNKEAEDLLAEAQTRSSMFEPQAKINKVLEKINSKEKAYLEQTNKLNAEIDEYNFSAYDTVKKQTEAVERIKKTRDILKEMVTEREASLKELRSEVRDLRDVKISTVDIRKEGSENVSFWRRGIREDWLVPEDLGRALKNMDSYQAGFIMKYLKIPADILRATATRLNIAFPLSNIPRDIQTAVGISENGFTKEQLWDALNTVGNFKNPQTREFFQQGGAFGGLIGAEKPTRNILSESQRSPIFNLPLKLGKLMEGIGERTENATRFAVYKGAIEAGYKPEMAAFAARNATVDFSKSGTLISILNQVVPFLNARVQGTLNVAETLMKDPTTFVRRQLFQGVYPTMLLYSYNNQFPSYQSIPTQEKDNYWTIMYGEEKGYDSSGAPITIPLRIKIRKSETQMLASNVTERFLDLQNKENPRDLKTFLNDQIKTISPISASSLGPLTTPLELKANYDLFAQSPIEPEYQEIVKGGKKYPREQVPSELRAQSWNGATVKGLSSMGLGKLGYSPAQIEFIVGKIFAGTGKDILSLIDMSQTGLDKTGIPGDKATTSQIIARMPILRSVLGSSAGAEKVMLYGIVDKLKGEEMLKREIPTEMQAAIIVDSANEINKKQGAEAAVDYLKKLNLNKDMKSRVVRIKKNLSVGETYEKQIYDQVQSNDQKAVYIVEVLNSIDSKDNKIKLLKDLKPSAEVMKRVYYAQKTGKLKAPQK